MTEITQVVKRSGAVVPFAKARITNAIYRAAVAVGGRDRAIAERLADQVVETLTTQHRASEPPTVEEIQNVVEKVLIENGHAQTAKAYILYRSERAQRREERARKETRSEDNIPWRKIWESLNWSVEHGVDTLAGINERIARGEFGEMVRETNHAYNEDIRCAAEVVLQRDDPVRMVIIAGPSSSGKTTTTIKLSHLLTQQGFNFVPLTVDNYFYSLDMHPRDEHGDYDYETPQALDLELINQHLAALLEGQEVRIPFYDFKTGTQHPEHTPMKIGPKDIILIDSLHGLYAPMTASIPEDKKFKLYIEPLLQSKDDQGRYVRWTDLRLMRRMERDVRHRSLDPRSTLEHWHYVRSSELRNIIPYVNTTDYVVNSGLPYELPIMCARLRDAFRGWTNDYAEDPLRRDAYERAARVTRMLEQITPVEDDSAIPPDSLLREFIGGSCYEY